MVLFGVFLIYFNLAAWQKDGVPIATGPGDQTEPRVATSGNDFVVVYQNWVPNVGPKLRAALVNGEMGEKIWDVSVVDDTSTQMDHQIVIDKDGMTWIVFARYSGQPAGNEAIGLQKINLNGEKIFGKKGVNISPGDHDNSTPQLCLDGSDEGCYVTWQDYRSGNADVWAARVIKDGQVAWEKRVAFGGPVGIIASANDAIIVGGGYRRAWKIDSTGNFQWDSAGVPVADTVSEILSVVSDQKKGVIALFQGVALSVRTQKINSAGERKWGNNGVVLQTWPLSSVWSSQSLQESDFGFSEDGYGGCLVSSYRGGIPREHLVFCVDSSGNNVWPSGVKIWTSDSWPGYSTYSTITYDNVGGCIVTWDTHSDSTSGDILVQRVDKEGRIRFKENGFPLCENLADQTNPVTTYALGGAVVLWNDLRNGNIDIYGQFVDTLGNVGIEESGKGSLEAGGFYLEQNSPNPFTSTTTIRYSVPYFGFVSIRIYDASGREVRTLVKGYKERGIYLSRWDSFDNYGRRVTSGVYFYRLLTRNKNIVRKMVLIER
jgi:hypothetical protein